MRSGSGQGHQCVYVQSAMKSFSFIPFIIILILFSILFWTKLPETKNKSFDEIYRIFKIEQTTAYEVRDDVIAGHMILLLFLFYYYYTSGICLQVESLMKQPEKNKV